MNSTSYMFKPIPSMSQMQQQHDLNNLAIMDDDQEYLSDNEDLSPNNNDKKKDKARGTIQNGIRRSPNKWSKEENKRLFELVQLYGEKKWKRISAEMGSQKTGAQCAQHWKRVLSPDIRKGPWDEDEEELLLRLVHQHGSSWKKIAKRICKRTDIQCRYQYLKALQSREVPWVIKEDEALMKKVQEMDMQLSWLEVSDYLAKLKHTNTLRTALECKTRYQELTECMPMATQNPIFQQQQQHQMQQQQQHMQQYQQQHIQNQQNNQFSQQMIPTRALLTSSTSTSFSLPSSPSTSLSMDVNLDSPKNNSSPLLSHHHRSFDETKTQRITISNLTSPSSSPTPSPPSSPSFNIGINNSNSLRYKHSNSSDSIPSIKSMSNWNNNSKLFGQSKSDQHVDKKVKNGDIFFTPISFADNNKLNPILSDQSSDDDDSIWQPKHKNTNNNHNHNNNNYTLNGFLPKSFSTNSILNFNNFSNNNSNNSSRNSTPTNTSSPYSSPMASPATFEKLKSTSFDFFNLESLAALASTQPRTEQQPRPIK
ncbi:putative myb transcription factor [Cavenderia fasciculata]|uniref:Myb transcription factor n=1 Tax=Cavenderia fasciculata TaxID=261658 RepID=F4PV28_CACFS|nr:putative myb transcription factor [Cavenderia fasciculata]EGG21144.1 putative myb transcription factor [Cavenderia fasciculata]|eukprot:XP_004358994.1 putative myb transcription factor [Cavenderia fasciculata]